MTYRSQTGIPWLQGVSIPSHWAESRLKYLLPEMRAGDAITSEQIRSEGCFPVYGGNGLRGYTDSCTHQGTRLLVGRQGALCGNVHQVSGSFWASEHAIVAATAPEVSSRWAFYLLQVMDLGQYSRSSAQPGIGTGQIRELQAPTPPPEEQRAIADYLDRETAQIDILIEEQQRLRTLLEERLAAVLESEFTTSDGKSSSAIGRILRKLSRTATTRAGVITAYRDGEVTLRSNRRHEGYTMSEANSGYQGVEPGDLVFHGLDGFAGAVGVSDSFGQASPVYHVCSVDSAHEPTYVALLLRFLGTSGFLATQAPSTRQRSVDFRNWKTFSRVPVDLPSREHQVDFVTRLRAERLRIRALQDECGRFIDLTRERRAALITAAVTGQIDVEAAA